METEASRTWWIDEPRLLGSSNPTDADLELLRRDGFGLLVCLLEEEEQAPNYDPGIVDSLGFERRSLPVRDFSPPSIEQLAEFVRLIDASPGRTVVHCFGGSGRTGTFAAAYWISRGMSARDAVRRVRQANRGAIETREQLAVLAEYERSVRSE